jgi:hypothetical protein
MEFEKSARRKFESARPAAGLRLVGSLEKGRAILLGLWHLLCIPCTASGRKHSVTAITVACDPLVATGDGGHGGRDAEVLLCSWDGLHLLLNS